jgi:hypothetical protein
MALAASFRTLATRLQETREAFTDLRVAVVEDGPRSGAPVLVDQLGDAATDLLGWIEEASAAAVEALREAERPRDLEGAQGALLTCQEHWQQTVQRFAADLLNCARVVEIHDLGRERGRAWRLWSESVETALDGCQQGLLGTGSALSDCWREVSELAGAGAISVRATGIGQQINVPSRREVPVERAAGENVTPARMRHAG